MDERVAKLKTSQEARRLAINARERDHPELAAEAEQRAIELRAIEEGFTSPAQLEIAKALYAYEEERTRLKGSTFTAGRTRKMLKEHGALGAAERTVLKRGRSDGYDVLEGAGLVTLSFESIVDRFPDEFSAAAVAAARARLAGLPIPKREREVLDEPDDAEEEYPAPPATLDAEAAAFLRGFRDPENWIMANWLPRYRATTDAIAQALAADRLQVPFETLWRTQDNHISHAGQGVLSYKTVDGMREDFIQVIRDIVADGGATNFERIVERFEGWRAEGRIEKVPRLLIARAFAGLHPARYHTTVDGESQAVVMEWFEEHTGFIPPRSTSWAAGAQALVAHIDRMGVFEGDIHLRNVFPWFVMDQLRARRGGVGIEPGFRERPSTAFADLPAERRVIKLRHNDVQRALVKLLMTEFGERRVWMEHATGTGGSADALARFPDDRCHLYEVKIAETASDVVRQAMGQLLEYGFREGGLEPVKLFAVGEPPLDDVTRRFLARLRADFKLNIDYMQVVLPPGEAA